MNSGQIDFHSFSQLLYQDRIKLIQRVVIVVYALVIGYDYDVTSGQWSTRLVVGFTA